MKEAPAVGTALSVVIPVYNEESAIRSVVEEVRGVLKNSGIFPYEILVVDDGSKDQTAREARAAGASVHRIGRNLGVGAARTRGILKAKSDIIVMTDGDGSYPAQALPELVKDLGGCDMAVGARMEEMGTLKALRRPVKLMLQRLAEYMTRARIEDLNSGMRAFRRKDALRFAYLLPDTHSWVSTITLAYLANGLNVRYRPIHYRKRVGRSSFHPIGDTYNTLSLVARTFRTRRATSTTPARRRRSRPWVSTRWPRCSPV